MLKCDVSCLMSDHFVVYCGFIYSENMRRRILIGHRVCVVSQMSFTDMRTGLIEVTNHKRSHKCCCCVVVLLFDVMEVKESIAAPVVRKVHAPSKKQPKPCNGNWQNC